MAGEVTRHGRAHPYSWSITIVSLRSKESEESHRSEWKTKLLGMLLAVTCQHASGACQSHSCPVLNLCEASRKYVELYPSTPPFLTLQFYEIDLTPTPNLLRISSRYSLRLGIFDTPSAQAYLFMPFHRMATVLLLQDMVSTWTFHSFKNMQTNIDSLC